MKFRTLLPAVLLLLLAACSPAETPEPTATLTQLEIAGNQAFLSYCATCHALDPDVVIVGPSLFGIASRAGSRMEGVDAKTYIEVSIMRPDFFIVEGFPNAMPADLTKRMTSADFDAVVAFLLTLK